MRISAFIASLIVLIGLVYIHSVRLEGLRYERLARVAEVQNRPGLVLFYALSGLAVNPKNIMLNGYAGTALKNLKKYKAAIMHLEVMQKYYPNHLNTLINSAFAYYYAGNTKKAYEMRDRVARIKPSYVKKR